MKRILICGAGPTGISAGLFLSQLPQCPQITIIDQHISYSAHSKAVVVNPRTLHLLEATGVSAKLLRQGRQVRDVCLWQRDKKVAEIDLRQSDTIYPYWLVMPQSSTEEILKKSLDERGIDIHWGTALDNFVTDDDGVHAQLHSNHDNIALSADYLLGADGVKSTVRRLLNIPFAGEDDREIWQLCDLELDIGLDPEKAHVIMLPEGYLFIVRLHGNIWRVKGNMQNPLEHIPMEHQLGRIWWCSDFYVGHKMAIEMQKGPCFLAGDAAHTHSPVASRGMNLGIEDSFVFAQLFEQNRLKDYHKLRYPVDKKVVNTVKLVTDVFRGKPFWNKPLRYWIPWAGRYHGQWIARWLLGLDHEM